MNFFQKKNNLIADLFPKLQTAKRCLNKCLKKFCFRGHFDNRHSQPEEPLLKSGREQIYRIYWCLWRRLCRKKSLLLICKILKLFVNTLRVVGLYRTLWQAAWLTATSSAQISRTPPLIVIDHCEENCVGENLSYWYAKS